MSESVVNARCKKCVYRDRLGAGYGLICAFILDTGHSRGCPAGENCTRFERGDPDTKKRKMVQAKNAGWIMR